MPDVLSLKWPDMKNSRITIIGMGQVGQALLKVFEDHGLNVLTAYNRSPLSEELVNLYPKTDFYVGLPSSGVDLGDWIFITVSDDAIPEVVNTLSQQLKSMADKKVIHCSGTHTSLILDPLVQIGAKAASFHPMRSITKNSSSFTDTWFDIEGNEEALAYLEKLADQMGARTIRVDPGSKPFLHAAAVVASNYLVVLAKLVSDIAAKGNISEEIALKALTPLMENTIQNLKELGVTNSLTGPVERNDINTIQEHIKILQNDPETLSLYKNLGKEAVKITETKKGTSSSLDIIKDLLT